MKSENKKLVYSAPLPIWCQGFAMKKAREICKRKGLTISEASLNEWSTHLLFCPLGAWKISLAAHNGKTFTDADVIEVTIEKLFDYLEGYEPLEKVKSETIPQTSFVNRETWSNFKRNGEFAITFCGEYSGAKNKDFLNCLAELIDVFAVRASHHSYGSISLNSHEWSNDPNRNFETFMRVGVKHRGQVSVFMKSDQDDGSHYILDSTDKGTNWSVKRIIPVG